MKVVYLLAIAFICAMNVLVTNVASADPITITASNWKFAPAEITVHVNQPVALHVTSTEGVHGLQSSEFGIPQTMLAPGSMKTITFTPTKIGTYVIHCSIPCGPGHANMALTIHVVS